MSSLVKTVDKNLGTKEFYKIIISKLTQQSDGNKDSS